MHLEVLMYVYYTVTAYMRRMRWTGHVVCIGERRDVYRVLVEKTEGQGPLGRPRRRSEDNI
jgi:hypothetical protein